MGPLIYSKTGFIHMPGPLQISKTNDVRHKIKYLFLDLIYQLIHHAIQSKPLENN